MGGMNLMRRAGDKRVPTELRKELVPILLHPLPPVRAGKPEVQSCARGLTHAAVPRAEGMHQPWELTQPDRFKPGNTATRNFSKNDLGQL
jgi:hypothetical protein